MANTKVTGDLIASSTIATGNIADNAVTSDKISGITTAHITEGSNLYYTDARARGAISVSGNALSYNSSTGVITSNFEEAPTFTGDITLQGGRIYVKESDLGNNAVAITRDADEGYLQLFSSGSQTIELRGNGNSYFNGGNVGIGTASPNGKLNISNGGANGLEIDPTQSSGAVTLLQSYNRSGSAYTLMRMNAGSYEFQIADSTKMRIDSSGNVGIGTTSPSFNVGSGLEISRAGVATLRVTDSAGTTGSTELLQADADGYLFTRQSGALVFGTNDTERMRIDSSGKVGIGTTMNINKLDVAGNINVQGGDGSYLTFNNGDANIVINNNGSGRDLSFKTYDGSSNSERMRIDKDGNVIIGNTNVDNPNSLDKVLEIEHGGSVGVILNDSRDTPIGLENRGAVFHLTHNTNSRLVVDGASGKVGIGTTSPTKTLQVNGSMGLTTAATDGNKRIHTYPDDYHSWYYKSSVVNNQSADVMTYYQQFLIRHQDSTNVFIIRGNGNVGINTTSPSEKLHVVDTNAGVVRAPLRLQNEGTTTGTGVELYLTTKTSGGGGGNTTSILRSISTDTSGNCDMVFLTPQTGSASEKMRIKSNGKIGIGTTAPKTNLEVIGGLNISTNTTSATTTTMRIGSYGASSQTYYGAKIVAHTNFTSTANTDLSFDLGALGEVMRLHCSGSEKRVGIGTNSPTRKLDVAGEITHEGLVPKAGAFVDGLVTIDKTVSTTANTWTSLDISLSNIGGSGTFAVQVYSNAHGSTGAAWYSVYWSGIMSWYHTGVNDDDIDEIPLHMAGHARNNNTLELRTKLHTNDGTSYANRCELQIKTANTISSAPISFRFRKLL